MKKPLLHLIAAATLLGGAAPALAQADPSYNPEDLVLFFRNPDGLAGTTDTLGVSLGRTWDVFRRAATPGESTYGSTIYLGNVGQILTETYGSDWTNLSGSLFAGSVGNSGSVANLSRAVSDGDYARTVYITKLRSGAGNVGQANSAAPAINVANSSGVASAIAAANSSLESSPGLFSTPNTRDNNPLTSTGIPATAYTAIPGGVMGKLAGAGSVYSFDQISDVALALDLYRITPVSGASSSWEATHNTRLPFPVAAGSGYYLGTITLTKAGAIYFTAQGATGAVPPPVVEKPVITGPATASGQVGVAFNYQIVASNSPTSYAAVGLPDGLNLDSATGLITGTPSVTGTTSVTLTASNAGGSSPDFTLTLNIAAAPTPEPVVVPRASFLGLVGTGVAAGPAADFVTDNGLISFKTFTRSNKGRFTGSLRLGVDRIRFKGEFDETGTATVPNLVRKKSKLPNVAITLNLTIINDLPKISGSVVSEEQTLDFVALSPKSGLLKQTYTMALMADNSPYAGYGFATLKAKSNGSVRLTGKLPNGSRLTSSTILSDGTPDGLPADDVVPVYVANGIRVDGGIITDSAGNPASLLTGELLVAKSESASGISVDNGAQTWGWVRRSSPSSSQVVLEEVEVKGRSFALTRGVSLLSDSDVAGPFRVTGLPDIAPIAGSWPASNKPSLEDKRTYRLRFTASTGALRGFVKNPKTTYEGVMFGDAIELIDGQGPVFGAGFSLNPAKTESALVEIN